MKTLPPPDAPELKKIIPAILGQAIYRVFYEYREQPLTLAEVREKLRIATGEQGHFDRRVRSLYSVLEFERTQKGREHYYRLLKVRGKKLNTSGISMKVRASVLRSQRCAQCGRTPLEDNIRLHVDHKIPQKWGGTNEEDNLQPLCSECNGGKRDFYATFDKYTAQIKQAVNHDTPYERMGELLKAFQGEPVPSDLLEQVASAKQYQDDWQKRLRELRVLGWMIDVEKRKEGKRVKSYYKLKKSEPWPSGNIRAEITRLERLRKSATK